MGFLKIILGFMGGIWSFVTAHPQLIGILILVVASTLATYHYTGKFKDQKAALDKATADNIQLTAENKVIKANNAKLTADMVALKKLHDTFDATVKDNKTSVQTLENKVSTPEFQKKASTDIRAAEKDFNNDINSYLNDINTETSNYAK